MNSIARRRPSAMPTGRFAPRAALYGATQHRRTRPVPRTRPAARRRRTPGAAPRVWCGGGLVCLRPASHHADLEDAARSAAKTPQFIMGGGAQSAKASRAGSPAMLAAARRAGAPSFSRAGQTPWGRKSCWRPPGLGSGQSHAERSGILRRPDAGFRQEKRHILLQAAMPAPPILARPRRP